MIRNIVFDYGQVLIHFDPHYIVRQFVSDERDAALLEEVVFDRLYWDRLDAGTISHEEVADACCRRLPVHLWELPAKMLEEWIYHIPPMEGMEELVAYLKERYPVKLFLLSNISTHFASHAHEFAVLQQMDGCIFSATCGYTKPSREIFTHLCKVYHLLPEETLFIDDNAANVAAARAMGIHAYPFDGNATALRAYLERVLQ